MSQARARRACARRGGGGGATMYRGSVARSLARDHPILCRVVVAVMSRAVLHSVLIHSIIESPVYYHWGAADSFGAPDWFGA
jgi:hypothetical protein